MKIFVAFLVLCIVSTIECRRGGWKVDTGYRFKWNTWTVSSMPELKNQWTGMHMRGELVIVAETLDLLVGKLLKPEYAQVNQAFSKDWWKDIPATDMQYKPLALDVDSFQINIRNDSIYSLAVQENIKTSELNILKGIVSQLTTDLAAINEIRNNGNQLLESEGNQANYRVMESTVNGECETLYDVVRSPKYMHNQQSYKRPASVDVSKKQFLYEVIKTKNFDNCREIPVYRVSDNVANPTWADNGIEKSSETRMMLYGSSPEDYTIQLSETVDQIIIRPSKLVRDQLSVVSKVSLMLIEVDSKIEPVQTRDLVNIGNIVFTQPESPIAAEQYEERLMSNYLKRGNDKLNHDRPRRHIETDSEDEEKDYVPKMSKFVQYERKLKEDLTALEKVRQLLNEMSRELHKTEDILKDGTLNKFIILSNIIRFQLTESQIVELYRQLLIEDKARNDITQTIFRDAVADSGSNDAVRALIDLIVSGDLQGEEAAQVIATWPKSIRVLNEDLQKKIFDFATSESIQKLENVNSTVLLALTGLMDKYCNIENMPSYCNTRLNEVVSYLSEKLRRSVNIDTQKTLTYIRALRNLGNPVILKVLEPYLEGRIPTTDFERFSMVVALDKLRVNYPDVAKDVLYRIYQNPGERHQVRSAAVFQLMRTYPDTTMIRRIVTHANAEPNNHVRAAVKAALKGAAEMEWTEHREFVDRAKSGLEMLRVDNESLNNSRSLLRDYVNDNLAQVYNNRYSYTVGSDNILPNAAFYHGKLFYPYSYGDHQGWKRSEESHMMYSNVDELLNLLIDQVSTPATEGDNWNLDSEWSTRKIAKFFNIQTGKPEELQGQVALNLLNSERFYGFDRSRLQNMLNHYRNNVLVDGWKYSYNKIYNTRASTVFFPLPSGMTFIYTYREPTLIQVKGVLRLMPASNPLALNISTETETVYSTMVKANIGFFDIANQLRYSAGYEKKVHVMAPLNVSAGIDLTNNQIEAEIRPITTSSKPLPLLKWSSWPYIGYEDANTFRPIEVSKNIELIQTRKPQEVLSRFGDSTGFVLLVEGTHQKHPKELAAVVREWREMKPTEMEIASAEFFDFTLSYDPMRSTADKIKVKFGFETQMNENTEQLERSNPRSVLRREWNRAIVADNQDVRHELLRNVALEDSYTGLMGKVSTGSTHGESSVLDISVAFEGKTRSEYRGAFALAKDLSGERLRLLANIRMSPNMMSSYAGQYEQCIESNLEWSPKERAYNFKNKYASGRTCQDGSAEKMSVDGKLRHNEDGELVAELELEPSSRSHSYMRSFQSHMSTDAKSAMTILVPSNRRAANISVNSGKMQHSIEYPIPAWAQPILSHTSQFIQSSEHAKPDSSKGLNTCSISERELHTFDGNWLEHNFGKCWHLAMHTPNLAVPTHEISVLVRDTKQLSNSQQKDVLIIMRRDNEKDLPILLTPPAEGQQLPRLKIDGVIQDPTSPVVMIQKTSLKKEFLLKAYTAGQKEIRLVLRNSLLQITYDGKNVEIRAASWLRNNVRGVCGSFTDEINTDKRSPKNCILQRDVDFIASWALTEQECEAPVVKRKMDADQAECISDEVVYGNVINDIEAGRKMMRSENENDLQNHHVSVPSIGQPLKHVPYQDTKCSIRQQTQVIKRKSKICFSIKPLNVCPTGCKPSKTEERAVEVHCRPENDTAAMFYEKKISLGRNPDMSSLKRTEEIMFRMPTLCA